MDDILARLGAVLLSYLGKTADVVTELFDAAGRKALEMGAVVAGKLEALGAKIAAVPLWLSLPGALLAVGLFVCYLLRQRLYDRVLVYHLIWVRRRGFARQRFLVRRGAVRETVEAMARRVALPPRFAAIAVYEVHPDHYLVAFGAAGETFEAVRLYRRDLRSGLAAMGADLIAYYHKNVRMLHADAELRALFAVLDGRDPEFAAQRPALGGERAKRAVPGITPETAPALCLKDAKA